MMRALAIVGLALCAARAYADPFSVALTNDVPSGHKPTLTITANEPVSVIALDIERLDDHKTFHMTAGPLAKGKKTQLAVGDGKSGRAHWKGHLSMRGAWGEMINEVTFESETGGANTNGAVKVIYDRAHLDLERGVFQFQVTHPVATAQLTVVADDGSEIARVDKELIDGNPGHWLSISWTPTGQSVLRLQLRVTNASGDDTIVKLVPWSVSIEHEEVIFPSGQSAIPPSENGKLEASYGKIVDAIAKVRAHEPSLDVRVYIAGHTDTVGGSDDNRKLSLLRARAIATWFREHGLPMPLYFAGFGEDQLKVKTPDNTDEKRNRRADYVIGVEEPASGRGRYVELK